MAWGVLVELKKQKNNDWQMLDSLSSQEKKESELEVQLRDIQHKLFNFR